jgi:hypothetical protein
LLNAQTNTASASATVTTTAPAVSAPADLSHGTSDVIKLFRAGKKDNALIFYAKFSELDYRLTAKHMAYLQTIGISPEVIAAMLQSDRDRQNAVVVQKEFEQPTFVPTNPTAANVQRSSVQKPAPAPVAQTQFEPTTVYPDYSAYPNYYGSFDTSDDRSRNRTRISIGIGVGVGLGDGGYYHHGYGGFYSGGRRWR